MFTHLTGPRRAPQLTSGRLAVGSKYTWSLKALPKTLCEVGEEGDLRLITRIAKVGYVQALEEHQQPACGANSACSTKDVAKPTHD